MWRQRLAVAARHQSRNISHPAKRSGSSRSASTSSQSARNGWSTTSLALVALAGSAATLLVNARFIHADTQKTDARTIPHPGAPFHTDFAAAIAELQKIFGEQVSIDDDERKSHGHSPNTHHEGASPAVVLYAESTEDVSNAMVIAHKYRMPVIPFSGGTSLEGHFTAPHGGLCIDISRMDKILKINVEDGDVVCQAGAGWQAINEQLEEQGIPLFFPLDPGPGACIGGMIATGCSGTNAMRYGTARAEWIINVTAVLPNGRIIKTRSRARKSSAGFDLTKLFIGAEGSLGIVTEATLRLAPVLPNRVAVCSFPNVKQAVACVVDVINAGLPVQCAELCDAYTMKAINTAKLCSSTFAEADSVFFKFQGDEDAMRRTADLVTGIIKKHQGDSMRFAADKEESDAIWHGRKSVHWSLMAMKPGYDMYSTDVCVPLSRLPQLVEETQKDLEASGITAGILGHAGDGNFHAGLSVSKENFAEVDAAAGRLVERAIALDGTCTGEHGVGTGKKRYLRKELGNGTVELMQTIKDAVDPLGIMNPGKLYPDRLALPAPTVNK